MSRRLKKKGFTLVEILVSLAIFGMLMVAFCSIFINAFALTKRAGNKDAAVGEAAGEAEKAVAGEAASGVTKEASEITVHIGSETVVQKVWKITSRTVTKSGDVIEIVTYEPREE